MSEAKCPKCGHEATPDTPCPGCGQALNGATKPKRVKPPPPPVVASWVIEPVPPEIVEHFRKTFNEEEFLAEMRETERTGGANINDLIAEIERKVNGGS